MARSRSKPFWWHVSDEAWDPGAPVNAGIPNQGVDIVLVLVDTEEPVAAEPVVPERDDFVVERIIGQFMIRGEQPVQRNYFIHERVYVVDAGGGVVALRDLAAASEADTSFLYHNVTQWMAEMNSDTWGQWQEAAVDNRPSVSNSMIHGPFFRDIKVGRRIREGEALIYHWQLVGTVDPGDAEFSVKPWLRTLVRSA